jgi:hypothetical protein
MPGTRLFALAAPALYSRLITALGDTMRWSYVGLAVCVGLLALSGCIASALGGGARPARSTAPPGESSAEPPRQLDRAPRERERKVKTCTLVDGQIERCSGLFQGNTVVWNNGFRVCGIAHGVLEGCGATFYGEAVVFHLGAYRRCAITDGEIRDCAEPSQGEAVVVTDR